MPTNRNTRNTQGATELREGAIPRPVRAEQRVTINPEPNPEMQAFQQVADQMRDQTRRPAGRIRPARRPDTLVDPLRAEVAQPRIVDLETPALEPREHTIDAAQYAEFDTADTAGLTATDVHVNRTGTLDMNIHGDWETTTIIAEPLTPSNHLLEPVDYSKYAKQYNKRIYLEMRFINYFLQRDLFQLENLDSYQHPVEVVTLTYFIQELLSRSPFLFNFLQSEALNFNLIFSKIIAKRTNKSNITITYNAEHKELHLEINTKKFQQTQNMLMHRVNDDAYMFSNIDWNSLVKDVATPITRDAMYYNTEIHKPIFEFFENKALTLDIILPKIPQFETLNKTVKTRIINSEFLSSNVQKNFEKDLEKINTAIQEQYMHTYDKKIRNAQNTVTQLNNQLDDQQTYMDSLILEKIGFLTNGQSYTVKKLQRSLEHPVIEYYAVEEGYLRMHTKPIILNIDTDKVNAITQADKKIAVQKGFSLGLGRHRISIRLHDFKITYKALDGRRNHHIEEYTCYGTFKNPITDAKRSKNLPKVIALAIQMLSQATIGDPAGKTTIGDAYIINKDNLIEMGKNKAPVDIMTFLTNEKDIDKYGGNAYAR